MHELELLLGVQISRMGHSRLARLCGEKDTEKDTGYSQNIPMRTLELNLLLRSGNAQRTDESIEPISAAQHHITTAAVSLSRVLPTVANVSLVPAGGIYCELFVTGILWYNCGEIMRLAKYGREAHDRL